MRFFAGCGGRDRPVRRPHPAPCETARFPCGGRVGHGCAGSAIARETDVGEDVGGVRGGGGNERAVGATMAERRVAIDGEGASDVADAGGPVRRGVGVGGGAAAGGRHRRPAAGADRIRTLPAPAVDLRTGRPRARSRATVTVYFRTDRVGTLGCTTTGCLREGGGSTEGARASPKARRKAGQLREEPRLWYQPAPLARENVGCLGRSENQNRVLNPLNPPPKDLGLRLPAPFAAERASI